MPDSIAQLVQTAATAQGAPQTRAAARLMSWLENEPHRLPELFHVPAGRLAKSAISSWPQPRMVLGLTGAPGSGKSTLTDALVAEYRRRHSAKRVGVIAVDPSSPFTGGAVLGDRVRMMRHATDPLVFVRSLASRGHLGGLSLGVRGVLHVLALIGCDLVIIETVGVGQSEVEIATVADLTTIVFAPGQGDSIQLLKAGLMEIGDVFVVNKADRAGAEELHAQILSAMKLGVIDDRCGGHHNVGLPTENEAAPAEPSADIGLLRSRAMPEVYLVSAVEHTGVEQLLDGLEKQADTQRDQWLVRRRDSIQEEIRGAVLEAARRRMEAALGSNGALGQQIQRVLAGEVSIANLATELLRKAGSVENQEKNDKRKTPDKKERE